MRTPLSVVIGAGGTGGHIYPGLALAEALRRADPDAVISFIGTERGLETTLIPAAGYRLHTVDMIPFDPALGAKRFLLPAALLRSGAQARSVLRTQKAQVVVGMGGYPSAPAIVGAKLAGLPSVIHESNAVPGRANQFAARLTEHLTVAFDGSRAHLSGGERALTVGMPIAASLAALDRPALRAEARRAFGIPDGARVVLFNGGSLGAARLTAAAVGLAARWRDRTDVHLLIKTGPAALTETRRKLAEAGVGAPGEALRESGGTEEAHRRLTDAGAGPAAAGEARRQPGDSGNVGRAAPGTPAGPVARAVPYLDRMDLAYAVADLVVCRAGSATIAELATTGVPAVLVPYPHAPGDHQTHNARVLSDAGAAHLVPDAETTADRLAELIDPLLADPARLAVMGRAADPGNHARAADLLAETVIRLAGQPTTAREFTA
ncbi:MULTISPECIES: UDP-N-acetylglucosamine--N-acetylmuramyl-(pentapeptide) pyrophosphoryl-undecaprenol N-acetylglucosamine transferase [unclassified Streptomyces]|uniref:UDP-N-acetylglucosamine--N-acetylmuramyl- (pentapeptide) pyrophosphoryl-undecaprenol N-acetylglucosamine transferase n=1 Tax=unclassified Streptomyces TaxID=2593676 RepID=UPI00081D3985|nr:MULTISPECIES: UDP-N-acetylglucosamine--N-acetylmuramyl-(pentapeptide) pyrophosphoryl-undecaprenol N-acetylglucosamine transferase [unclassified Streptomyces]MYR96984.1 UDP-N-acetylglucosamine--N-acetylmuramyl-(pentapeptide) pyrophosphoryl-undecaprenol N-acetylglucosamine transferase [Streptomyces sp. SID4937]SCE19030.1 UDP-N-acetylglucosamine-N-acetylmuramylpentapeptide N-acetylglucosamine transferase [Streptomyces sp. ScaeMP-e83]